MRVASQDGTQLHVESVGSGVPIVFVHEFAGDHRSWEPQLRFFSRSHRCVTFSARGYPPSDVPADPAAYGQDRARADVIAVMDHFGIAKAHVVGHSMGAYTTLHVGLAHGDRCLSLAAIGCGWGSDPNAREAAIQSCVDNATMFSTLPMVEAAAVYARAPMRLTFEAKDPRGFAKFERMLAEHSGPGSAATMLNLQAKRPTLWEMEAALKTLRLPVLVMVGDEDFPCLDGSLFLKRVIETAGLQVVPRAGHTLPSEEPAVVNAALATLFSEAEGGTWMRHRLPA